MKMLQDSNGNTSSKRIWGTILLSLGSLMQIVLFIFAIKWGVKDPATASNVATGLILTGAGLLGIGVLEGFKKL